MRQIVCEKNHAPLAPPAAPKAICKNPPCPKSKQPIRAGGVSDGVSVTAPAHAAGSSPRLTQCGCNDGQTTTEQPSNEKTALPSFTNNSLHDKVNRRRPMKKSKLK